MAEPDKYRPVAPPYVGSATAADRAKAEEARMAQGPKPIRRVTTEWLLSIDPKRYACSANSTVGRTGKMSDKLRKYLADNGPQLFGVVCSRLGLRWRSLMLAVEGCDGSVLVDRYDARRERVLRLRGQTYNLDALIDARRRRV